MKKLSLIIIAICLFSSGMAQKQTEAYILINKGDTVQVMTIADLLEYQQECYNDSTKICYRTICDLGCMEIVCDCGSSDSFRGECKTKYVHRVPTFIGFIEWIRKKYSY